MNGRDIVSFCLLSTFLFLMMPNISAIQSFEIEKEVKSIIDEKVYDFKDKIKITNTFNLDVIIKIILRLLGSITKIYFIITLLHWVILIKILYEGIPFREVPLDMRISGFIFCLFWPVMYIFVIMYFLMCVVGDFVPPF